MKSLRICGTSTPTVRCLVPSKQYSSRHPAALLRTTLHRPALGSQIIKPRRIETHAVPPEDDDFIIDSVVGDEDFDEAFKDDDFDIVDQITKNPLKAAKTSSSSGSDSPRRSAGLDAAEIAAAQAALAAGPTYNERPHRSRTLKDLLEAAGYTDQSQSAPDIDIFNVVTCNSETAGDGSLYVCVMDVSGENDGHDWVEEAAEVGAVAVIAEREIEGCSLPVVLVDSTLSALGKLAAEFYDYPSESPDVTTLSFVGTYGKTTTSWLVRGLFEEKDKLVGMIGTIDYSLGEDRLTKEGEIWELPLADLTEEEERRAAAGEEIERTPEDVTLARDCSTPFHVTPYGGKYEPAGTTPDALHMQKTLAGMVDRGAEVVILEVDPAAAADGRMENVFSDVIVFTNIDGTVAAACPGGVDEYVERVNDMFEGLTEDQTVIINLDDVEYGDMFKRTAEKSGATVLTYSAEGHPDADVVADKIKAAIWDTEITVRTPVGSLQIIQLQVGRFNVANVLAAVCVGLSQGIELRSIVAGIEAVEIVPGRCELIDEGQAFPVIVDAAATPQQLSRLIDDVKEAGARRTVVVMGCPGTTTPEHRGEMAFTAHYKADMVIFTNDDPGGCMPDTIITEMVAGLPDEILSRHAGSYYPWLQDPHRVPQWFEKWLLQYQSEVSRYVIEDRFSAIRVAIGMAKARDVILVLGKGDRDYQLYWDGVSDPHEPEVLKGWFDDRVECRNALSRLSYLEGLKDLDRNALPWTRYPEEREAATEMEDVGSLERLLDEAVKREETEEEEEEAEEDAAYGI